MNISRTYDKDFIRSVIGHPEIKPLVLETDDIPVPDDCVYLKPCIERYADGAVEDVAIGVIAFKPLDDDTWNPHIAILPEHRGCGTKAMRLAIAWMHENMGTRFIVAFPPAFNKQMIRVFDKLGFRRVGLLKRSLLWRGILNDRLRMELELGA